jgi:hypothetical protein
MRRGISLFWIGLLCAGGGNPLAAQDARTPAAAAAATDEDFHVFTDSPRLLLTKQRLRLLTRERERQSPRWQQFDELVTSGEPLPETALAQALYFRVSGNAAAGRKSVEWALDPKTAATANLRQLALVFDWCASSMSPDQQDRLAAKIEAGIGPSAADVPTQAARALAAIAIADHLKDQSEAILRPLVQDWFRGTIARQIQAGHALPREQTYALMELMHVVRDNLSIDLRESSPAYFRQLPVDHLEAFYPAPLPGPKNDFFIQAYARDGDPDLTEAALARAAGMAMVAYDTNAPETQYLQGWLMQNRFMMRDALGSLYEFLWANPYQPGLSYTLLPLVFHDVDTGHVFARSSWEEDAAWIGYFDGHLQLFRDGQLQSMRAGTALKPFRIGDAVLLSAPAASGDSTIRFEAKTEATFVMGLEPRRGYDVEIDDEELSEARTDTGGTLVLGLPPETMAGVRIKQRP